MAIDARAAQLKLMNGLAVLLSAKGKLHMYIFKKYCSRIVDYGTEKNQINNSAADNILQLIANDCYYSMTDLGFLFFYGLVKNVPAAVYERYFFYHGNNNHSL